MTALTEDVRAAAGEADAQSGEVRRTAGVLEGAVRQLRQTVIRVVRTSTQEVDRRRNERVDCDLPAELDMGRGARGVRVLNLSVNGALVAGAEPVARDQAGLLLLAGMRIPVAGVAMRDGHAVLRLTPEEEQERQVLDLMRQAKWRARDAA